MHWWVCLTTFTESQQVCLRVQTNSFSPKLKPHLEPDWNMSPVLDACCTMRLNGAVLQMIPQKPWRLITAGQDFPPCCNAISIWQRHKFCSHSPAVVALCHLTIEITQNIISLSLNKTRPLTSLLFSAPYNLIHVALP